MHQPQRDPTAFHVVQIALGMAMCVFMVAFYARPMRLPTMNAPREVCTQETVYLVTVKYLSSGNKPEEAK